MSKLRTIMFMGTVLWLASTAARAECRADKVAVTLINPSGKVIELCVPESALDGVSQGASSSGAELIAAVCPCFTQEDVEATPDLFCEARQWESNIAGEACNSVKCTTSSILDFYVAMESSAEVSGCTTTQEAFGPADVNPRGCITPDIYPSPAVTVEEAEACVAILRTFLGG